ncbi:MAG TPA: YdeI/OmpD-associated family protein [Ferruginibacter sp.]|nr:YdeI/OmpD-associated family protein [Ferruginibacter sp.]
MPTTDKKVDAYIEKSQEFAKPILRHIRALVHKACPAAEEKIKWSFPHFDYKGEMMCSMAAFKQHCAFGFWKAALMKNSEKHLSVVERTAMGHLGKITSKKDLPPDKVLISSIREAMKLNDEGLKVKAKPAATKADVVMPDYFIKALGKNKKAKEVFGKFSPSNQREYIEWLTEAKTGETRNRRIETAIEWIAENKSRNWKYK